MSRKHNRKHRPQGQIIIGGGENTNQYNAHTVETLAITNNMGSESEEETLDADVTFKMKPSRKEELNALINRMGCKRSPFIRDLVEGAMEYGDLAQQAGMSLPEYLRAATEVYEVFRAKQAEADSLILDGMARIIGR